MCTMYVLSPVGAMRALINNILDERGDELAASEPCSPVVSVMIETLPVYGVTCQYPPPPT